MKNNNDMFLSIQSVSDEKYIWILSYEINALFQIKRDNMSVVKYYIIPSDEEEFMTIAISERGVYMAPYIGEKMFYLDYSTGEMDAITFSYDNSKVKVAFTAAYKDEIVMVSSDMKGIIYWNEKTQNLYKDDSYIDMLCSYEIDVNSSFFIDQYCQIDKDIYVLVIGTNVVLKIDVEKKEYKAYQISNENNKLFYTIDYFMGNTFVLTDEKGNTIFWNVEYGIEKILVNEYSIQSSNDKGMFLKVLSINNKTFYFAIYENRIWVRKDNEVYEIGQNIEDELFELYGKHKGVQFGFIVQVNNEIYFQTRRGGVVYCLNTDSEKIVIVSNLLSIEKKREIVSKVYKQSLGKKIINESELMGLSDFIKIF